MTRKTPGPGGGKRSAHSRRIIETEALIVAYAMSRLDDVFLRRFGFNSWQQAFDVTGKQLHVRPASMKNLRDEFDPIHPNARKGWHKRPLRANRQRVIGEFCVASDEAIIEVVMRLLAGDKEVMEVITKPIARKRGPIDNVAERLRTGRFAETFFMENCEAICGFPFSSLLDCRGEACGFDFSVRGLPDSAIEVKGIKGLRGDILFTDREWNQANRRKADYWLIVVGGIPRNARAEVIKDPASALVAKCDIRQITAISWRARVALRTT